MEPMEPCAEVNVIVQVVQFAARIQENVLDHVQQDILDLIVKVSQTILINICQEQTYIA